ncbi:related to lysophospholipase [Cephalotrichum gorgonifer]|uniref:Related to lysophospholipase n=1 Tax=Cephalotrichum gorgonifer TaxID=2041049 RepID=A0AAE8SW73_9PEZI|nr:related to lysophospholipase [Cephalotrichum gorgonifer]
MEQTSAKTELEEGGGSFGPVHIIQPRAKHTHTAILLHGRGSTGEEFAEELFESNLSSGTSLQDEFPGWRWVFPSSRSLWSTTFKEYMPAWFETRSLTDPAARQDLQVPGIKESVTYLRKMLDQEIAMLGGQSENLVLGGISLGGATAIWTLLSHPPLLTRGLCAFLGASTWLPFAADIKDVLSDSPRSTSGYEHGIPGFAEEMVASFRDDIHQTGRRGSLLRTPVFFGHGNDDAYVDVELGREAADVLSSIGFNVEWRDYTGAEQEGHWLKVPEEVDDIRAFLNKVASL